MSRLLLQMLRTGYRARRREDAKWSPDPYAARNNIQRPPQEAARFLASLPPRWREAVAAAPLRAPLKPAPGPRAQWYRGWAPRYGKYANLNLAKRVALRGALVQMASPELRPLQAITHRLEAQTLRSQAETRRLEIAQLKAAGLPYD